MIDKGNASGGEDGGKSRLRREMLRRARRGGVIVGGCVFAAMLVFVIVIRLNQFRMIRWDAFGLFLRFDLLIIACGTVVGTLIGSVTGAILAVVSMPRQESRERQKHPLD